MLINNLIFVNEKKYTQIKVKMNILYKSYNINHFIIIINVSMHVFYK